MNSFHVMESFTQSREGPDGYNGDGIAITEDFAMIVDGATPKGEHLWEGLRGDVYVAWILTQALYYLPPRVTAGEAINYFNNVIRRAYEQEGSSYEDVPAKERLQASIIIYSNYRQEIWMFGDCKCLIDGQEYSYVQPAEPILSNLRSLMVEMERIRMEEKAAWEKRRKLEEERAMAEEAARKSRTLEGATPDEMARAVSQANQAIAKEGTGLAENTGDGNIETSGRGKDGHRLVNPYDTRIYEASLVENALQSQSNTFVRRDVRSKGPEDESEENKYRKRMDRLSIWSRQQILPLLTRETLLCNADSPFGYDALNGGPIKENHVLIYRVQPGQQVIMASDGYPQLRPSLLQTENYLREVLWRDPWCLGENLGTKGVVDGNDSYDDRSYIRFVALGDY